MGLHHNPRIVTDGLVFAYDVANGKSYKGAPTTNILQNTVFTTGWEFNGASYAAGKLTETAALTSHFALKNENVTISITYTMSVSAKAAERTVLQLAPSTGFPSGIYTNFDLINGIMGGTGTAKSEMIYEDDGWWRCTYTETASATTSGRIVINVCQSLSTTRLSAEQGVAGYGIMISDPQMEAQPVATAFTSSARSTTQSLYDLTGNNTITATSITPAANNTFEFNGTSDYITTDVTPNQTTGSISSWFKINTQKNYNSLFENSIGPDDWECWIYSTGQLRFRTNFDQTDIMVDTDAGDIVTGRYYFLTITWTASSASLYIDDSLVRTDSTTGTRLAPGTINIGGGANTTMDGSIASFTLCDRALLAAEVKQNFEATRSRFGL